ncbi:MAG: amidohydrolase [Spirochaetes bacterium]|nr:MAG: amidohydrolase [Spirochaetota bacterium]
MLLVDEIAKHKQELIELRRDFHMYPELGFQEFRTSDRVEQYLKELGLETRKISKTGVVATLRSKHAGSSSDTPTLMLRADMDGLPIQEENNIPYKSKNSGVMHACGHDAHMAMLLVAAKVITENYADKIGGNIKFVFQPNEEITGAEVMIEDGVLENPRVNAAIGIHVWSPLESGIIGTQAGPVTASLDVFKLVVYGKGGHTGYPESAIDPIIATANIIQSIQIIQTREINAQKPTIIMFARIEGGSKSNIIPDSVTVEGSMRYLYAGGEDSAENPRRRFERIVKGVSEAYRTRYEIEFIQENYAVVNNPEMVRIAKSTAEEITGDRKKVIDYACMAGEDFSAFAARVPAVFLFLGTGNKEKGSDYPHHNPRFNIDEDILPMGVELFVRGALKYFQEQPL